jgi:hypothetical protein
MSKGSIGVDAPQVTGFDPHLTTIRPAYPTPPFPAFAHPIVEGSRRGPRRSFNVDRRPYFAPLFRRSLPVLVVDDIHVHRHLACFVFAKINSAPAHHATVVDAPLPAADVSRLKPHPSIRTRVRLIRQSEMRATANRCTLVALHTLLTVCTRCNPCRPYATNVYVCFRSRVEKVGVRAPYMSMPPLTPQI